MKTIFKTAVILTGVILFVSCGNTSARNGAKTEKAHASAAARGKSVKELNSEQFNKKVYDMMSEDLIYLGDKPAIVDFTATWCGPCQRITPILEELAAEMADEIVIYKVDIDKNRDLAEAFNISSIPAILYIPAAGEPVMTVGARGKEKFKEEIRTFLLPEK